MTLIIALVCAAALLALAAIAVIIGRYPASTRVVYGASLISESTLPRITPSLASIR